MYLFKFTIIIAAVMWTSLAQQETDLNTQVIQRNCSLLNYTTRCFKLDLLKILAQLGKRATRLPLISGISLISTERTKKLVSDLDIVTKLKEKTDLDKLLWDSTVQYIGSLDVILKLDQSNFLKEMKSFSDDVWSGRGKKGWYTIGTLAAVGFAALAGLAGKALTAAVLSLFISVINMLRGPGIGGFGSNNYDSAPPYGKVTQYDIITRPYINGQLHDHDHHHFNSYIDTYAYSRRNMGSARDEKDKDS